MGKQRIVGGPHNSLEHWCLQFYNAKKGLSLALGVGGGVKPMAPTMRQAPWLGIGGGDYKVSGWLLVATYIVADIRKWNLSLLTMQI